MPGYQGKKKSDQIRIVIADDHMLIREMLCRTLNQKDSIKIVGEAANGLQAIDVISELKPDVALLDIIMPDVDGINVLPAIREKSPKTKALMLTCLFSREMGKNRKTDSIYFHQTRGGDRW